MSVETSQLEGKDRDELVAIVTALGGKPGRAKKADLVDMIVNLSSGATPAENGRPRGRGRGQEADESPTDESSPAAETASTAEQLPLPAESAADTPATDATGAPVPARRFRFVGWSGDTDEDDGASGDEPAEPASNGAAKAPESPGAADAPGGDDTDEADSADGAPGGRQERDYDGGGRDGEGGRRRRRRGRDRNRGDRDNRDRDNRDRDNRGGDRDNRDRGGGSERGDRDRDRGGDRFERAEGGAEPQQYDTEPVAVSGYLDLRDEGYGFLRIHGASQSRDDAYVSVRQVRQFGLRKGDHITGASRPAGRNEKNPALLRIDTVNALPPEEALRRPRFEDRTPLFPDEKLRMELTDDPVNMTARIIDLISPIGKGQRGLIVSPPKAGKTTIMKQIARSIEINNPEVVLFVLLVDERPEEVTDMRRWLTRGEVVASTFDRPADEHTHVAELTIERAKRLVEYGKDVVIILDGITRLARAYNLAAPATGRIMSGGVDSGALYPPKKFFGAARNVEEGGSLTILATALVETGSRMDEVIFEEFKGTGNMELRLDRRIAERRIYPAIDVGASSTRHEELLFERKQLQQVFKLRRVLSGLQQDGEGGGGAALELLIDRLKTFKNNGAFLDEVAKGPSIG